MTSEGGERPRCLGALSRGDRSPARGPSPRRAPARADARPRDPDVAAGRGGAARHGGSPRRGSKASCAARRPISPPTRTPASPPPWVTSGVDWSAASRRPVSPHLEASARLLGAGPIPAGDPFVLEHRGHQHRRGDGASGARDHRLRARRARRHRADGGSRSRRAKTVMRDLKLHVMPWHSDFTDKVRVQVHAGEPDAEPDAKAEVLFDITGAPRPSLAYDWWIVDDPELVAQAAPAARGRSEGGRRAVRSRGQRRRHGASRARRCCWHSWPTTAVRARAPTCGRCCATSAGVRGSSRRGRCRWAPWGWERRLGARSGSPSHPRPIPRCRSSSSSSSATPPCAPRPRTS